jgi:hypothetical protein
MEFCVAWRESGSKYPPHDEHRFPAVETRPQ